MQAETLFSQHGYGPEAFSNYVTVFLFNYIFVQLISQVIVIDKGKIAEEGTHEQLLAKNGVYKKLVLRQLMAGNHNVTTDEKLSLNDDITDVMQLDEETNAD